MKFLAVTVEMPTAARHPMQEFSRQSDDIGRVELITWNVTAANEEYVFFRIEGAIEAYRRRIKTVDSIREFNLTPIDDDAFYSYVVQEPREAEQRMRRSFASRNLVVVPPIVYDEDARMRLTVVGDPEDLQGLIDEFPTGFSVTVEEIGDYDRHYPRITSGLTDRQLAAIETAVEVGYYDVPRQSGLEAIARELGCAESTASTHLRKAESRIMRQLTRAGRRVPV